MNGALTGRSALVTGASSGIGHAIALALGQAGVRVALSARRADRLNDLKDRIVDGGGQALALAGDVSNEDDAASAVARTVEAFGGLDILINSAGIIEAGSVEHADLAQWRRVLDVNFFGSVYTCKAAIPHMKARGAGDIVNISSISGRRSAALFGAYAPSKFALNAMSEGLRQEVGGHNIRVCVIEPGATTTEVHDAMSDPEWREKMRAHVQREGAVSAASVASIVLSVLALPPEANVSELMIRPTSDTASL